MGAAEGDPFGFTTNSEGADEIGAAAVAAAAAAAAAVAAAAAAPALDRDCGVIENEWICIRGEFEAEPEWACSSVGGRRGDVPAPATALLRLNCLGDAMVSVAVPLRPVLVFGAAGGAGTGIAEVVSARCGTGATTTLLATPSASASSSSPESAR